MTGSLAFRKNEASIRAGDVPEKYTRLLPFITGERILEIGSAEGVLSLLLAQMGKQVTAIEKSEERHESAANLYSDWLARESKFNAPKFINGTIGNRLDLLQGIDTLVAVRMIYYLRGDIDRLFRAVAEAEVRTVVLCGNKNRAARWRAGVQDEPDGPVNFYASGEGMTELLKRHHYKPRIEMTEGDPIVVGQLG